MNLFENLQLFKENNESEYNELGIDTRTGKPFGTYYDPDEPEEISEWDEDVFDDQYDGFDDDTLVKTEGVTDIIGKIKNWFEQNKNNKLTKNIQSKIDAEGGDVNAFFNNLVPASGKADTKAGELIRAMMRLLYRDYNDGDIYFSGYGIESCGPAATYLVDNGFDSLINFADEHRDPDIFFDDEQFEKDYTNFLNELADEVIDVIRDNPNLLIEENTEDMLDCSSETWKEFERLYDYTIELNYSIQQLIDDEIISLDDLENEISTWDYCRDVEQEWGQLVIKDLTRDEYDMVYEKMDDWLEEYAEQFNEEGDW